jgi:hypothetical protein
MRHPCSRIGWRPTPSREDPAGKLDECSGNDAGKPRGVGTRDCLPESALVAGSQGLSGPSVTSRPSGPGLSAASAGRFSERMLLAPLPRVLAPLTQGQCRVLATEVGGKCATRCRRPRKARGTRLDGLDHLGARDPAGSTPASRSSCGAGIDTRSSREWLGNSGGQMTLWVSASTCASRQALGSASLRTTRSAQIA